MVGWHLPTAVLALCTVVGCATSGLAQQTRDLDSLNRQVVQLYKAGKYDEAIPLAQNAIALTVVENGPGHPTVGTRLTDLAELYRAQGRYAEAEPVFKRALAITEKALGPDHPDVGTRLSNLAALYEAQGRYAEAEPLKKRALAIREKTLGPDAAKER